MAISRMQQPRQMYGLGSFVKKLTRKVTKPFTKVARKIVPREIAGIMRAAAPFLPPGYREAAYLLGTAKQTGRISPVDLALTLAPTVGRMTTPGGQTVSQRLGGLDVPFTDKSLGEVLVGSPATEGSFSDIARSPVQQGAEQMGSIFTPGKEATSGIFGKGGEMFQFGKKDGPGIFDTKAGQTLFGKEKPDGTFGPSFTKLGSIGVSALSLIQNSKTPDEAGKALAASTGDSADYDRGYALFSQLTPELFEVPEQFRMNVKGGGLMRTNYANGTPKFVGDFNDKYLSPEYADEFKKFLQELKEQNKEQDLDNIMEMFKQKMRKQDPIREAKEGGLMRTNYAMGSDDDDKPVLPDDPTKPINPFGPKPIKPLGDMKMAEFDLKDYMEEFERVFPDMIEKRGTQEYMDMLEEYFRGLASKDKEGIMMAKEGGRANLALGTKPTPEESGLGGLPIEADMRYTGGFMPYGAKEKADDVPARLSKNEFVFTADAVRAAGGGSVNEGAKKMYQAMKQLEAKPEAKGMMA